MGIVTTVESAEDLSGLAREQVAGVTGHAVLVDGEDETGSPAVAVWHVSTSGIPVGAWITPTAALEDDPAAAEQVLRLLSHRALFGWDTGVADRLLKALARWAGRSHTPTPVSVLLPDLLAEVDGHRRAYTAAVAERQRSSTSKLAPLSWRHDVPEVTSWSEFVTVTRLARPRASSPVAAEALHLTRAVAWTAELWHDTETARGRRSYLVERFGPTEALPPQWLARLREAQAKGLL